MTESNCFSFVIRRIPREIYEEGLKVLEKTYTTYRTEYNHWTLKGKKNAEPTYPRVCHLNEVGAAIMNAQIVHDNRMGKSSAIVRKATARKATSGDHHQIDLESIIDNCDDIPHFMPTAHAAVARELARSRQDVCCRACKQWGHCVELGGQCDFLAQHLNCEHYIKKCIKENNNKILKTTLNAYDHRQKDRRRVITKNDSGKNLNNDTGNNRNQHYQADNRRGRSLERTRSTTPQRNRPRTPSAIRGLAHQASGQSVTFEDEGDMPFALDDSNILFADDASFFNDDEADGDHE